jgi:hypothetical protein
MEGSSAPRLGGDTEQAFNKRAYPVAFLPSNLLTCPFFIKCMASIPYSIRPLPCEVNSEGFTMETYLNP